MFPRYNTGRGRVFSWATRAITSFDALESLKPFPPCFFPWHEISASNTPISTYGLVLAWKNANVAIYVLKMLLVKRNSKWNIVQRALLAQIVNEHLVGQSGVEEISHNDEVLSFAPLGLTRTIHENNHQPAPRVLTDIYKVPMSWSPKTNKCATGDSENSIRLCLEPALNWFVSCSQSFLSLVKASYNLPTLDPGGVVSLFHQRASPHLRLCDGSCTVHDVEREM